jgi:hypothetical protein
MVAIGPDPYSGESYFCNFTRPFQMKTRDCMIYDQVKKMDVGLECLFCLLIQGGGTYGVTVWLEGQRSEPSIFNIRGRAIGLKFQEAPSERVPKDGLLEKQPKLKVIDDLDDNQPLLRPNDEFPFNYWEGPKGTFQEYNPDGKPCFLEIARVPDPSTPFENPCSADFEEVMRSDPSKVGTRECFEADMPLSRNYKRGVGLQNRVEFKPSDDGMATFSDIQFIGHPAQRYNLTFTVFDLGNILYVKPQTFSTSWLVNFEPCPLGQIGTWNRKCECARGFELGGASGCQRCEGGVALNEGDSADERGRYKPVSGPNACTKCPSKNMITKNSTARDSIGTRPYPFAATSALEP